MQKAINFLKHLPEAILAVVFYRFSARKLKFIGVTGTDGKTTTVNLIYHLLVQAGFSAAMVSTVSAKIGYEEIDTGFHVTSPNPWLLQKLLKRIVNQGTDFVVLEATSHGLDQFRLLGIKYEVGVLTNVTHEHLDYHKTFESYRKAKLKLFLKSKKAVLNKDDNSFSYFEAGVKKREGIKIITYGIENKADFTPGSFQFVTKLPGEFNQYNCLAAIAAVSTLGIPRETIKTALASFEGVAGRMEEIDEGQNFRVIIDFAHTPNAQEQILGTLKKQLKKGGKLTVVFGAAGLRDREKRPMMGEIAGTLADLVILTAEDPRTEKVKEICEQIAAGCREVNCEPKIIPDRQEAIEFAVNQAQKNDIIVICGKGHEKSMSFGSKEYPWSDKQAVKKALRSKKGEKNEIIF